MKPTSHDDSFSDSEAALDEFFRVREIAPNDFAQRTIAAARRRRRRAQIIRFSAWSSGLAACFALVLGLGLLQPTGEKSPDFAFQPTAAPEADAVSDQPAGTTRQDFETAEELTALLYAALEKDDVVLYGHARELELLLAEATSLYEEENLQTLDFLILLAEN